MQQSVRCYVQGPPRLFVYCCRLFLYEIHTERSQVTKGLVIVVANAKPDNAITEIVLQESCRFRSIGHLSILLKPSVPFFFFQ